jgi:hypothetical protein
MKKVKLPMKYCNMAFTIFHGMFTALGTIGTTNTDHPQILVGPG